MFCFPFNPRQFAEGYAGNRSSPLSLAANRGGGVSGYV